ncbi:prepilin-type cleavage/methylation domain-containing protein [Aquabacterium olei]|uniref:Prepilin-type cleavage/methylation domain-containing protein n=1 Tax=Aquabacterium olei TaxID=1296669 RepID=A0A2U8FM78_9BURK|nr:prepilin-type N-terminal cleavage/methylation domain-containing protein [Aquabacterium olei]AWI52053.1 prepilin-type cleavage/methylation domain-containing protein [Aquabacterium olei]
MQPTLLIPWRPSRAPRGFTLIEVLLIVALIGVLAAIALPMYHGYQDRTRTRIAAQDIAAISVQIQRHWDDNRAFPADLAAVGANRNDPWGRPYVYYNVDANGRGGARKDRALNPINSDFDLYSMGPDGVTKSQVSNQDSLDDVIRGRDGQYVGVASEF